MIDEKKLIEDLLNHDGMNFVVKLHDFTPEGVGCFLREYTDKLKEGFIDLINAQPKILFGVDLAQRENAWIPVSDERKPKQLQECLCVCAFEDDLNWRWQCVLKWHGVPYQNNGCVNRPHFTDEGVHGMVVTHWMPLPELPKDGEP